MLYIGCYIYISAQYIFKNSIIINEYKIGIQKC